MIVCSSVPLLGCVAASLVQFFTSDEEEENQIDDTPSTSAVAQKHLRQLQNIRTS
ncbi:hypothetical protein Patl1_20934 [Pistacia atlantica]|uniref:Uncharacterized protein n=1 Tax=Pistacia atlantica TaxID=434234 RepID=A0ACC1BIY0_9ROSI|nr:hypothetical protein Patl1_20934 [Pistacia atlantica]